ncbi:MAG: Mut7-C ubiquitin/RNAse domain-containing protein [Rhizorhabdus sp.]|uniref:Mut7-C RNAse domain-containing protein n=1 Tax=Rhizorhabdus sp. TaxID=1968843 RepID=UPI001B4665DD|nr:Mut7-C RNAse domain-containing protein [Rhizorhabdus sp.]MBP8235982.1 Mut7-C ubiquitin/RNAse domain-containing protein [Rhizorhabdus sp.]
MVATFRFYEELNDFIARDRRRREFDFDCATDATVKHVIEALGVPHTEVELILVNGVSVDFARRLRHGDRVSVYPKFEAFDISPLLRLRPYPLRVTRFVADAHLGGLAHLLRMAGFDTVYDNAADDVEIQRISGSDERIVLTRDRDLLKRRGISRGCYVYAQKPDAQLSEILTRLDLAGSLRPLSRCLKCNAPLVSVDKAQVIDALPPRVRDRQHDFSTCQVCRRVFWEGSHWRHMRERLAKAVSAAAGEPELHPGADSSIFR